jgi:peptidoglycan/xylan/chitin deacetylase (PgdA/CDA1 family)
MKRQAKNALGWLAYATRLDAWLRRRAGVVVAFHRVQDGEDANGLSVGRDMFERHCRFFKRHFDVVHLRELVSCLEEGRRVDRLLAITFDDGYHDNFANARPVLEALSLPATFFVVSQWMGTDAWPWWDREQGVRHRWMTWDHVRRLNERGFDIGAHTRTHADLGQVDGIAAREEIVGARREIERQLGRRVDLFAYPYGRRPNLSESNRALVRAAGFRCCCSCYGGLTPGGADPFRLQRIAVTPWYDTPHELGMEFLRESGATVNPEGGRCSEISAAIGY